MRRVFIAPRFDETTQDYDGFLAHFDDDNEPSRMAFAENWTEAAAMFEELHGISFARWACSLSDGRICLTEPEQ